MPIFESNGKKYNVQDEHIEKFGAKFPDATTVMERDGKKYRVKANDYNTFLGDTLLTAQPQGQSGENGYTFTAEKLGIEDEKPGVSDVFTADISTNIPESKKDAVFAKADEVGKKFQRFNINKNKFDENYIGTENHDDWLIRDGNLRRLKQEDRVIDKLLNQGDITAEEAAAAKVDNFAEYKKNEKAAAEEMKRREELGVGGRLKEGLEKLPGRLVEVATTPAYYTLGAVGTGVELLTGYEGIRKAAEKGLQSMSDSKASGSSIIQDSWDELRYKDDGTYNALGALAQGIENSAATWTAPVYKVFEASGADEFAEAGFQEIKNIQQRNARVGNSTLNQIMSGVGSMVADLPFFGMFGKVASFGSRAVGRKVVEGAIKREAAKQVAKGATEEAARRYATYAVQEGLKNRLMTTLTTSAVQSGLTFGLFDVAKEATHSTLTGDWDAGKLAKSFVGGTLMGAVLGGTNATGSYLTRNLTGAKKVAGKVGEFAVENAVFTEGGHLISEWKGEESSQNSWLEDYLIGGATLGVIKLPGVIKNIRGIKANEEAKSVYSFTEKERELLTKNGEELTAVLEEMLPKGEKMTVEGEKVSLDGVNEGVLTEQYVAAMNNPEIPLVTKAKLMAVVEGKVMPAPRVTTVNIEGNAVKTYDPMGRLVETKEFKTTEEAKAEYKKATQVAEIEGISFLEDMYVRIKGYEADDVTVKEWLAKNPDVKAEDIANIIAKDNIGEPLTKAEQKILDSLREARREGLNDAAHLNDVLAGLEQMGISAKDVITGIEKPASERTEAENKAVNAYRNALMMEVEPHFEGHKAKPAAEDPGTAIVLRSRESDARIDETANNGVVYTTTNNNGEKIVITGGKVVLDNEGFIDVNQSEGLVALMPDGTKKPVRVDELREKIEGSNAEELKAAKREEIRQEVAAENGWKALEPGAEIEIAFDGDVYKLKVEGRDERGDVILSGEGESMAMPESIVQEGMKEAEALKAENGKVKTENQIVVAPVEVKAEKAEKVETAQPIEQPGLSNGLSNETAPAPIPVEKRGKEERAAYHLVPIERTMEDLHDGTLEPDEIVGLIDARIKEAESDVKAVEKKKPVIGADKNAYVAAKQQWQADMEAAKAKLDYYNQLKAINAEAIRSEMREAVEAVEPQVLIEQTPDEFVANQLGGFIKITPESFQKETGLKAEQKQMVGVIAGKDKGGVTIEQAAEIILENYGDELRGLGFNGDMQDVRDMIINILSNGNPRSYAKKGAEMRAQESVEQQISQLEGIAIGMGFKDTKEMIEYEEAVVPRIIQDYTGFDETEYFNNLAENIKYDTTRESEGTRRGSELLQGEQSADNAGTGNITEPGQGGEIQGDVYSGGENAAPQGNQQVSGSEIPNNQIPGLKGYTTDEVLNLTKGHITDILGGDISIVDMRVIGSRSNGTNSENSDLDVLVEFDGDISEDAFFNAVNGEDALYIDGVRVDINPITKDKSGTIEQWMNRNAGYSKTEGGNAPGNGGVVDNNSANVLQNGDNELNLQKENESDNEQNQNDIPVGGQVPESVPQGEHRAQAPISGGAQETAARLRERIEGAQGDSKSGLREVENRVTREFAQENGLWIEDEFKLGVPFPSGDEHNNYIDAENQVVYKVNNRMHTPSILDLLDRIEQHNKYFPDSKYSLVGFTSVSKNGDVMPVFAQDFVPDARMATVDEIDSYMGTLGFTRVGDGRYSNGEVVVKDLKPRNVLVDPNGDVYVVDAEFEQEKAQKGGDVKDVSEETTPVEDKDVTAFDKQAEIAKEREQRAGVAPRPGHLAVAIGEGNEKAVEEWKTQFDSYLQKLNADDLPTIDVTIKGMQGRKKDIRKMKKDGYKDDSIYKAYDYIETVLKKRKKELDANGNVKGENGKPVNVNTHSVIKSEFEKKALRERAEKWAKKLGVKVNMLESYNEVMDEQAKAAILEQRVPGWFAGGEVYIYIPHLVDEVDLDRTIVHESVAHKGIKQMLGEEFGKFLDNVWNAMSVPAKAKFLSYVGAGKNATQSDRRAAADEYVAALAEKVYKKQGMTAEEKTIWQKFADWFRKKFNADEAKAEVLSKETLTDEDIAKMIRASYETLKAESGKVKGESGGDFRARRDDEVASVDGDRAMFSKKGGKNNESPANSKTSESGQPASAKRSASLTNVSAKVGKNVKRANRLDAIISSIEKIGEMGPHEFLHEVVNAMLLSEDVSTDVSRYVKLGGGVTLRLADHYGKASNYKGRKNEIYNYGLVVKLSNKAFVPDKNVDYLEYVYFPDKLTKERQIEIAKGLKAFIETGRYELLPKPDKVNPSGNFQRGNGTKFRKVTPEMDAEYMSAVENGDMETAERLVKEAAKLAMPDTKVVGEDGFPKVAWTTGEQQAERYALSRSVADVVSEDNNIEVFENGVAVAKDIRITTNTGSAINIKTEEDGTIHGGEYDGKNIGDVVGKELATKLMNPGYVFLSGDGLRIGGEGMKGFYDKMLPSFVSKHTKKWGAKVGTVEMPNLEQNNVMHSVDVTPEMKESVMEGQTMFRKKNKHAEEFNKTHKGGVPVVEIDPNNMEAELAEEGFDAEYIKNVKERMEKGAAAFYDPDRNLIYLLDPTLDKERVYSYCWHENTHVASANLGVAQELKDEFYSLAQGKKKENLDAFLKALGYEKKDYPEESIAHSVQAMAMLDKWEAGILSKLTGSTAEGAQRQMEIIQPLIDYINNGRQGNQSNLREDVRNGDMYNTASNEASRRAKEEGAGATATGGLTEEGVTEQEERTLFRRAEQMGEDEVVLTRNAVAALGVSANEEVTSGKKITYDEAKKESAGKSAVKNSANFVSTYKTEDGKDINYTSERAEGYGIQGSGTGNSYDGTGNSILQRQTDTGVPGGNSGLNTEKGEFCVVERVFTENGAFNFTSGERIESADDVAYIFSALEDAAKEHSFVVYVKDGKPTVIELGMGSFNTTMVDIPTASLAYSRINPDHVYFVHNHPSGNLICSDLDVKMLREFEGISNVPVTGVIINLKTGKYGTFDTERHSAISEKRVPENEQRLTVHTLDKQIFAPDYDPMAQPLVRSSQDVAQFLNSQRMGDRPKVSFLILSRANRIIGNIHTPFTDITTDIEAVARYINERVIQFGGENAVLYGDFAISYDEAGGFRLLQNAMGRFGETKLLDVVRVEGNFTKSANDYGFLYEPEADYGVVKESEQGYVSTEQDVPVGEVESKPISRIDLSNGPVKGVNEPEWKFKARREKWRRWVESNTNVKTPMPEKPFLQEGESIEEYEVRMKEFNKELNKWKKDILSNESEIEKMMDILYEGKIPEMNPTPEDEFTEQVFKRYMGDDGIKVDRKNMRGMIMDEIIERRRKIETNNFDDVVFIDKVRKATTAEQRKAIPFIIEGTYNGKVAPELAAVVNRIRDWFENVYQALQAADAMHSSGKIKNYVTHIWDKKRTPKAVYENYISTRSKYTNRRSIETYAEGIALGMVPKYDDICDIMLEYGHIANEAIANKDFTDFLHMLRVDGEPVLKDATIRDPMYVRTSAEALDGYKVHKYAKGIVETVLGNIRTENAAEWMQKLAHFYDLTGSLMKKINLSLSFFHHGALIETAVGAMGPAKTISTVFKNLVWDCVKSGELPALSNSEAARNAVNHLVQLGATQDYMAKEVNRLTGRLKEMLKDFSDKHPNFATKSIVKPAELLDFLNTGFDKVLWDYLHDGLKIYTFDKYAKEIEEYCKKKGVDDTTKDMLLNEAGQFVNDTFGGQFWELINQSPATVKWMRRLLLSPDWTVSTIRQALAPLGFGTLYKDYEKNWFKRTFSGISEAVTQRRKMGAKFWIIAMLTFIPLMNALNAWRRKNDVDEELKKAEERRKTDPEYKSPYELKYPEGMKWYDYTMYGNTIGHQTHLFGWRYDDGKEGYIRWGKQFRELPELFLGKDGFSFPGPMIDKMVGKANPALSASLAFLGYAKDGWQSKWMKDKKGWEKELGRVMMMASAFMPYSIPTDEDKEFRLTDLMMPSSKGFSNYKAIREFETAILAQDFDYVGAVYDACVMNKLDAEKLLRAAIARVEAQAKAEYVEGANTLNEAWDKYQEDLDVSEKRAVRAKFNKLLQENAYKDFEKQEARDMVQSVLDGTYREEKLPDAYVANETPDDVRDAYKMDAIRLRLKKVVDDIPEDAEAYKQYYEDNRTKIDLYDEVVAAKREINFIMKDIKITPQYTEQYMQEIRDIRREVIELANNLTSNNE